VVVPLGSTGRSNIDRRTVRRQAEIEYDRGMAEGPTDDGAFNTEALKLLLQVAWANDELHPKEREFIEKLGKAWRVPAPVLEGLLAHLDQGKPLPPPDVALLRTRPDKVLRAAEALVNTDGVVDLQEEEMLTELRAILGV
jgi:hypothetical protein